MANLGSHTKGDGFDGRLWVFLHPVTKEPLDLTGWAFEMYFKQKRSDADPVWPRSTETDGGLLLVDGDDRVLRLCDGTYFVFAEAGFPYGVEMEPAIPDLAVSEWYYGLRGTPPGGLPKTYEQGRIAITWEDS